MTHDLEVDGFVKVRGLAGESERQTLLAALGEPKGAGSRGLLAVPEVYAWAVSAAVLSRVTTHLGPQARPVRAIFFDKSPAANWLVPWHQDVTLAVQGPVETPGFGPWSRKDGIPHVQAPAEWLARMLTVRLHLDACDASNGALRVIPGSHRYGRLAADRISALKTATPEVLCEAAAGDGLLMRPLLLHASSKSIGDRRRRILHIEYCSDPLPAGMAWHEVA
jgi:ectoine hydroxylase-related dioxygenase (phytanoyl-CoA dioxygenase family)